ncbi:MAG: hypothetical protein U9O18_00270 [Chloroflexota bacterium]|nr:hypothetical protein [Chloroflexota bacterium]
MSTMRDAAAELAAAVGRMDDTAFEPSVSELTESRRVMLYGCGREG